MERFGFLSQRLRLFLCCVKSLKVITVLALCPAPLLTFQAWWDFLSSVSQYTLPCPIPACVHTVPPLDLNPPSAVYLHPAIFEGLSFFLCPPCPCESQLSSETTTGDIRNCAVCSWLSSSLCRHCQQLSGVVKSGILGVVTYYVRHFRQGIKPLWAPVVGTCRDDGDMKINWDNVWKMLSSVPDRQKILTKYQLLFSPLIHTTESGHTNAFLLSLPSVLTAFTTWITFLVLCSLGFPCIRLDWEKGTHSNVPWTL